MKTTNKGMPFLEKFLTSMDLRISKPVVRLQDSFLTFCVECDYCLIINIAIYPVIWIRTCFINYYGDRSQALSLLLSFATWNWSILSFQCQVLFNLRPSGSGWPLFITGCGQLALDLVWMVKSLVCSDGSNFLFLQSFWTYLLIGICTDFLFLLSWLLVLFLLPFSEVFFLLLDFFVKVLPFTGTWTKYWLRMMEACLPTLLVNRFLFRRTGRGRYFFRVFSTFSSFFLFFSVKGVVSTLSSVGW